MIENDQSKFLTMLTRQDEEQIKKIPFLNIDTYTVPSPHVRDKNMEKDYQHSYVWNARGEILGYVLVYSTPSKDIFHLYKQVTSPFGRGKGIGSAFIERLTSKIPEDSLVYLYIWEKQFDSIHFFESKGFKQEGKLVYRNKTFCYMQAKAGHIRNCILKGKVQKLSELEKLGKIRHDARKYLQLLLDMVNMLSADNSSKIIEDINRESSALINLLNDYGDKIEPEHTINLKDILIERVIPYIESAGIPCAINLNLKSRIPEIIAHYVDVSRALLNIVSNSIDAIKDTDHAGVIDFSIDDTGSQIVLEIKDNGVGIEPERLQITEAGLPLFVGKTTKPKTAGEGYGTQQIYSTFGADNIEVESKPGKWTKWTIKISNAAERHPARHISEIERRYSEVREYADSIKIDSNSAKKDIEAFIWLTRKMELLCYDLVSQLSNHNNIRDIYRSILAYRYGGEDYDYLRKEIDLCRIETPKFKLWLLELLKFIKRNETLIGEIASFEEYSEILFKSYWQTSERTIIFTLDPETGRFLCADRKLAEHLDLVPYLGKSRDQLLRGEITCDCDVLSSPVILGVWDTKDEADLIEKLSLIRQGAKALIGIGFKKAKRLGFYHTTYNKHSKEIDTYKTILLDDMANLKQTDFDKLTTSADDELQGFAFAD
ncbi:MAG: GNAT family N-acetyltransferase [Planctomycetota bacterium]|jgi:N-acetylglutamate synthase-like GNAT family acetyltransferase